MKRWYLVAVQFGVAGEAAATLAARLQQDLPIIENTLKTLSENRFKTVLRSAAPPTSIWMLQAAANARDITARIANPEVGAASSFGGMRTADTTREGDKILVLQLGSDRQLRSMNVIQKWLDREWNSA